MRRIDTTFPCGGLSLEGVLNIPDGAGSFPAVIVCHPHPLYGGSMYNNVVDSLCQAIVEASFISFKFNFGGVGGSEGVYSNGVGEREDAAAAIAYVSGLAETDFQRIGLAGYSAGAGFSFPVGIEDARVKALAAVSPPLSMYDFSPLKDCIKPKLLISGNRDGFVSERGFIEFCGELCEPREFHVIDGADHFWWGYEAGLAERVAAFFSRALKYESEAGGS
jgi:alpha/beta superfamily hydrolase